MNPDPPSAVLGSGGVPAAGPSGEGGGLLRLSLMVDTVFDRLTSVDDQPQEPKPAS